MKWIYRTILINVPLSIIAGVSLGKAEWFILSLSIVAIIGYHTNEYLTNN